MRSSKTGASILRLLLLLSLSATSAASAAAQKKLPVTPRPKPKTVDWKPKEQVAPERSLPALRSRADFDRMARVYTDQPYALPHVIFVIDRRDHNKIYYVNSQRFRFHKDFVKGTYLSLENAEDFFRNNYLKANRRFILGTLAWQAPVKRYTFEHWEGDLVTPELIKLTADVIKKT